MGDHYESFEVNDYDLESAINPYARRRLSKHQQIYGVWADEDSDEERGPRSKSSKGADYSKPVTFVGGQKHVPDDDSKEPSENVADDKAAPTQHRGARGRYFSQKKMHKESYFAGTRDATEKEIGSWEKHTKGIGAKLLEKMGYRKGEGLGKSGQGIAKPLEAVARPGRGAIGLYGPEKAEAQETVEEPVVPSAKATRRQSTWSQSASASEETRVVYKTWEQVVQEGGTLKRHWTAGSSSSKIIDMTGAEQKVYESYEDFAVRTKVSQAVAKKGQDKSAFDVPELLHNVCLILGMTEDAMVSVDKQLKTIQDQNFSYHYEEKTLRKNIDDEERQLNRLLLLDQLLDNFASMSTIAECKRLLADLQENFAEEYKLFGLSSVALAHLLPALRDHFHNWDPLKEPDYCVDAMLDWRPMLEESSGWNGSTKIEDLDVYHQLVWIVWMPPVRQAVQRWNVRQPEPMLALLQLSRPIVPSWILENLTDQFILPKIEREAESWDPVTDTQPLHLWIHPWLAVIGDRLKSTYPSIRHKFARAMTRWNPSDRSAKWMLKPWREVFAQGSLSAFLNQHVLPKLENCLQMMVINPANQQLNLWHDVMDWLDMIHPSTIAASLVRHFFPKWHQALHVWLTCPQANYSEISNWYSGWKSLFPAELLAFPSIRDQFTHGLNMMNMALSGQLRAEVYAAPPQMASYTSAPSRTTENVPIIGTGSAMPSNFRDVVDRRAAQLGVVFMPVPDKYREGKPVYRFGQRLVYIDRNVIFMQSSCNFWRPVSLEQLVASLSQS